MARPAATLSEGGNLTGLQPGSGAARCGQARARIPASIISCFNIRSFVLPCGRAAPCRPRNCSRRRCPRVESGAATHGRHPFSTGPKANSATQLTLFAAPFARNAEGLRRARRARTTCSRGAPGRRHSHRLRARAGRTVVARFNPQYLLECCAMRVRRVGVLRAFRCGLPWLAPRARRDAELCAATRQGSRSSRRHWAWCAVIAHGAPSGHRRGGAPTAGGNPARRPFTASTPPHGHGRRPCSSSLLRLASSAF